MKELDRRAGCSELISDNDKAERGERERQTKPNEEKEKCGNSNFRKSNYKKKKIREAGTTAQVPQTSAHCAYVIDNGEVGKK